MRIFKLVNSLGQTYSLNNIDNFFHDVSGLGYDRDTDYLQIGNRYVPQEDKFKQHKIAGKIRFKGKTSTAYDKYYAFIAFSQHSPLTIYYTPSEVYRIDVMIDSIKKTEIETIGLDCDITFASTSLFYKDMVVQNASAVGGKTYNYKYSYTYSDYTPQTVSVDSDSVLDSPCKIYIYGRAVNPHWYHYLNGELVTEGKISATVALGDKLIVDSMSMPYSIKELNGSNELVYDRYQKSDFTMGRFVFLGYGHNVISVGHDGTETLNLAVEGMVLHETV